MRPVFLFPVTTTIIDCGATRTSLGVFKLTKGRLRCEKCLVEPFPVHSAGEDTWLENTVAALQRLGGGRRWPGPAVLVLPPHLTLIKQIKAPVVEPAKRAKIIRFEAEQSIPHALTEVVWDWMRSGRSDATEEVLMVAAKREPVDRLCAAAQAAGFRPGRIMPSVLTTLAGFRLARPESAEPALVLNVGGRSTTLLQLAEGSFAARTIAQGGGLVTRLLAENQDCDLEEAERIKLAAGSTELVAAAVDDQAGGLAREISRSVLHFNRQCGLAQPARIFLTGGGARLSGMAGGLGERLRVPVEPFEGADGLECNGESRPGADLTDLVGAAAIALLHSQPAFDLLPPGLRRREDLRRRQPWLIAAALLAVTALVPPIRYYRQVAVAARAESVALEAAVAPLRAREQRNRANLARLEELKLQAERLGSLHDRRTGWVRLLAGLQERLVRVEDVWLEKLELRPAAEAGPMKVTVSGRMLAPAGAATVTRVRELLTGMAGLPAVTAVEGEHFDPSQPGLLRFDFGLVIDPARPL